MWITVDEDEGVVVIVGNADELEGFAETIMLAVASGSAEGQLIDQSGVAPVRIIREQS